MNHSLYISFRADISYNSITTDRASTLILNIARHWRKALCYLDICWTSSLCAKLPVPTFCLALRLVLRSPSRSDGSFFREGEVYGRKLLVIHLGSKSPPTFIKRINVGRNNHHCEFNQPHRRLPVVHSLRFLVVVTIPSLAVFV